jgi:hypothetical protein
MPIFYHYIDFDDEPADDEKNGEHAVLDALQGQLDNHWRVFHGFEWRELPPMRGGAIGGRR